MTDVKNTDTAKTHCFSVNVQASFDDACRESFACNGNAMVAADVTAAWRQLSTWTSDGKEVAHASVIVECINIQSQLSEARWTFLNASESDGQRLIELVQCNEENLKRGRIKFKASLRYHEDFVLDPKVTLQTVRGLDNIAPVKDAQGIIYQPCKVSHARDGAAMIKWVPVNILR